MPQSSSQAVATIADQPVPATFGYELESKQVRQYRINDVCTVKCALEANIEEYLTSDIGVPTNDQISNARMSANIIAVIFGIASHWHPFKWPGCRPFIILCVAVNFVCQAVSYYISHFVVASGSCFLESDPTVTPASVAVKKKSSSSLSPQLQTYFSYLGGKLVGKRIRLSTHMESAMTTEVTIEAQLLANGTSAFKAAKVLKSVEKTFMYGRFFDQEGHIYPPNVKKVIDDLLSELVKAA